MLAFLYWTVKVDANDVELVLGRLRREIGKHAVFNLDEIGPHAVWMLDFDCCGPISMDRAGVKQAARSFWRNDPYYPRPPGPEAQGCDVEL
ncbi:zinc finger protein-domain-containing protein [Stachybotrys elegans]|uniref:Zinc finger protein-domain-containing protein n=1 Tax=Stachybotrys elegans TaxID=80388 RepID=A0A8K0SMD5_9HYPO|nr:zinc finger protein-domain-containing protein [Stachybotrys elegans]